MRWLHGSKNQPAWQQAGVFTLFLVLMRIGGVHLYVKKLEIHGFKSFPDKTLLELTPGITVVVGPNGCGKSNIVDAIRWVLGEQSAKYLRGTRMDDIIFSGTANRKPLSFAEVTVTLDNSDRLLALDYQEVSVTRRLYRNGESEYLLNKRQCRLRDILEMFMDTGIGKEAYSFISQGRVDEILNARPEERRQIFEEAAGILKYKNRKREAERRLAETAENLLRIGDIIHELSSQLGPLEEQAETARCYLGLRDRLKACEIDLLVSDAGGLRSRWYELDKRFTAAGDELLQQQTAITRQEIELSSKQLLVDGEQAAIMEMQKQIQQFSSELEKIKGRTAVTLEKIKGVERQAEDAVRSLDELGLQRAKIEVQKEQNLLTQKRTAASLQAAQAEHEEAEGELAALESLPEAAQAVSCREALDARQSVMRRLQTEFDRLSVVTEQHSDRESKLQDDKKILTEREHEIKHKNTELGQKINELKQKLAASADIMQQKKSECESLVRKNGELAIKKEREVNRLSDTRGKIKLLQELDAAMAGYYQGVKTVLFAQKRGEHGLSGIFGTVADIVRVPDEYVTAVEAVLGPALQNLVTEDENVAKKAIAYLKKTRGGRATFLPLALLERRPAKTPLTAVSGIPGYIGPAADFIGSEKRFSPVINQLFSRIHLVNSLDAAVPVARALQFRERVVTLEGDVILPGGAITGGAEKKQAGVLSRRKEVKSLQELMQTQERQLLQLEQGQKKTADHLSVLDNEINALEAGRRQDENELLLKDKEAEFISSQYDSLTSSLSDLEKEMAELGQWHEKNIVTMSNTEQALYAEQDRYRELHSELARLQGLLEAREQEKKSLRNRCTECRVRLAGLQKQQEHLEEEQQRLGEEIAALEAKKRTREEEIKAFNTARLEFTGRLEEDGDKTTETEQIRGQLLGKFIGREKLHKEAITALREEMELLRQAEKSLAGMERRQNRIEVEREKVEVELQSVLDRLQENWQLKFEQAEKLARPLTDRAGVAEEITTIKEEIATLGTVNLGSIEELKRITERVEFLCAQRCDLEEGEKDLQRIISEIDGRMGEMFASSFKIINENFNLVFKELFGGGRAQLRLTDPDNPLETGIEIVAQPTGKKLQHLSLLSGGEKALTAIALLFAFLKVKPAPFCILDEIETSLDEANLGKFCNYLQSMAEQIQFILITHRKKTMERADILYGVTMEESGISKLISVRLRSENPTAQAGA